MCYLSPRQRLRHEIMRLFILLAAFVVIGGTLFQFAILLPMESFIHVRLFVVLMLISGLFLSAALITLTKILEQRARILEQVEKQTSS